MLLAAACGDDSGDASEDSAVSEAERYAATSFSDPTTIDNSWMPLTPGTQIRTEGTTVDDEDVLEHAVVSTVTDLTKLIDGVLTVVVWDQDFSEGELIETEIAFFAQDDDGNVWRMGEHPEEYEDGELVEAPTWVAGIDDAVAGISMLAEPELDTPSYSQGWAPDVDFIDRGQVGLTGQETCVPVDCYDDVLVVDEFNVDEPGAFQTKFFAPSIGNIAVDWRGTDEGQEALEMTEMLELDDAGMEEARGAAFALEQSAYEISDVYADTEPMS